jgi:hypothetical protein
MCPRPTSSTSSEDVFTSLPTLVMQQIQHKIALEYGVLEGLKVAAVLVMSRRLRLTGPAIVTVMRLSGEQRRGHAVVLVYLRGATPLLSCIVRFWILITPYVARTLLLVNHRSWYV